MLEPAHRALSLSPRVEISLQFTIPKSAGVAFTRDLPRVASKPVVCHLIEKTKSFDLVKCNGFQPKNIQHVDLLRDFEARGGAFYDDVWLLSGALKV